MEVTEVRVSVRDSGSKKLKAYATVTFDDCFVVRNIKIIEGTSGLFVAMPARRMKQFCQKCGKRIDVGGRFCVNCGVQLPLQSQAPNDDDRREAGSGHQDIAHPINQRFRDYLQTKVMDAYVAEREMAVSSVESAAGYEEGVMEQEFDSLTV